MNKKEELKITEGSRYRIYSIGGHDEPLETEGVCKGFMTLGIDEGGVVIELGPTHKEKQGLIRVIPIHTILAVEILDEKTPTSGEEEKDSAHYYG